MFPTKKTDLKNLVKAVNINFLKQLVSDKLTDLSFHAIVVFECSRFTCIGSGSDFGIVVALVGEFPPDPVTQRSVIRHTIKGKEQGVFFTHFIQ